MKKSANFFEVWGGISGCQHLLPLMMNCSSQPTSVMSRDRLAELTSTHVAQRFGILSKGGISLGHDADLTLVDESTADAVSRNGLLYRHKQSAFIGLGLLSRVVRTILRGQTIFNRGKIVAQARGQFVRPTYS
jgi:allantoinase